MRFTQLLLINFSLACSVQADVTNGFILDYFNHKGVSTLVGYSCNMLTGDMMLIKQLNDNGMSAALNVWTDVTGRRFAADSRYEKIGVFLDTRCRSIGSLRSMYLDATNRSFFGELHHWLLITKDETDALANIDDSAFGLSTDLVMAVHTELDDFYLYDLYNKFKQRGCHINVTFYGYWNNQHGLHVKLHQLKSIRRRNLHGLPLRVLFFQSTYRPKNTSLEDYYQDRSGVPKDGRVKFGYFIIKYLADMYNFSIEIVESDNWLTGDTLGPLVRCLMNFSVDLSGTPVIANTERGKHMKFLHQGWPFRTCFIFRNPQPTNMKVGEISRPFANSVWYLMLTFVLASIIILAITLKREQRQLTIATPFTITLGAICLQCTEIPMNRSSTRIAFLSTMLFSLIMYNYYSACVVSARLDEPILKINDSLVELGKLNLHMASERMFFLNFFFAIPQWEMQVFKKNYWLKIPELQRFIEPETGMKLVQRGGFAYHVHPDTGYVLIEKSFENRDICELTEVHVANRLKTMFGVTNNSTLEELMRVGFSKISETGLRSLQLSRWQFRKPICRRDILTATSINIFEFAPHLILLLLGMFAAVIVYLVEILIFNCNGKSSTSSSRSRIV